MMLDGKRILIVEDENIIALDLASEVAALGARIVGTAGTVDAALKIIATTEMDGAIVDLRLRSQAGFLVADALTARDIPFIFATAVRASEAPARYANTPFVAKPFAPDAVRVALASLIRPMEKNSC